MNKRVLITSIHTLFCASTLAVLAGCFSANDSAVKQVSTDKVEVSAKEHLQPDSATKEKMLVAKDALFTRLSGRLMETMSAQGPVAAIEVCQKEAPAIAESVGIEHGVRIGRTSVRLRNPKNSPPAWAEPLIRQKVDSAAFISLEDGHAVALLPIKLQVQCLMCHGPKEQIAPDVQNQLAQLYPDDRATGFNEGDLRGWFWIEL